MKKLKVCWVSAGVSSFIAGYLAKDVDKWIYIDIDDQHEDSLRFIRDCEKVTGKKVEILKSSEYRCVEDCVKVFGGFRSFNGNMEFFPCTNWLKKRVRKQWEEQHKDYEITYVWGFDMDETKRAERMVEAFPEYNHEFPLIENDMTKQDAHGLLNRLDISRPKMYDLGFQNNNCIGCPHGGMWYWNKIRELFPDVFESRAKLERTVGHSILRNVYLDELEPGRGRKSDEIMQDCGIMCQIVYSDIEY